MIKKKKNSSYTHNDRGNTHSKQLYKVIFQNKISSKKI